MKLIVGLGNPGKKYEKTRHNTGFRVLENLKSKIKNQKSKVVLFKPPTFMNLSGDEVLKKVNFYRLKPKDLIVIYDDIDLSFGKIRVRKKGRSGGHKGVESIIKTLGSQNFTRVKIGVGRPTQGQEADEYVLEKFSKEEEKKLPKIIDEAVEKVIELI